MMYWLMFDVSVDNGEELQLVISANTEEAMTKAKALIDDLLKKVKSDYENFKCVCRHTVCH